MFKLLLLLISILAICVHSSYPYINGDGLCTWWDNAAPCEEWELQEEDWTWPGAATFVTSSEDEARDNCLAQVWCTGYSFYGEGFGQYSNKYIIYTEDAYNGGIKFYDDANTYISWLYNDCSADCDFRKYAPSPEYTTIYDGIDDQGHGFLCTANIWYVIFDDEENPLTVEKSIGFTSTVGNSYQGIRVNNNDIFTASHDGLNYNDRYSQDFDFTGQITRIETQYGWGSGTNNYLYNVRVDGVPLVENTCN